MDELRKGRRKRVRARSFLGAAAISASLTPACAFLTHQHQGHGAATGAAPSPKASEYTRCIARGSSLRRTRCCLPAHTEDTVWRLEALEWPRLIRSIPKPGSGSGSSSSSSSGSSGSSGSTGSTPAQQPAGTKESDLLGGESADVLALTRSRPLSYQVELFRSVMECERNSLVHLPSGPGKTLLASMVLRRLLELNPGRQAFFLVETTALAVQQAKRLRDEVDVPVETLTGSWSKLESIRAASIVVATAGAFERAMRKKLIDRDSICCVVLDEAHHCAKDHPFGRVVRSFLTAGGGAAEGAASASAPPDKSAGELPKVLALTAAPAGELTVLDTVVKIEELLDRLGADLVAPVAGLEEVKCFTSPVDLELVYVALTSPEITLLACIQRLVLSRVIKHAPEGSGARAEAESLLDGVDHWAKRPAGTAAPDSEPAAAASLVDDNASSFPSPAYAALINRALAHRGGAVGAPRGGGGGREATDDDSIIVGDLMRAAFAIDEVGGVTNWRRVLSLLETTPRGNNGEGGGGGGGGGGDEKSDLELEETVHVLKNYLPEESEAAAVAAAAATAAGGGVSVVEPDATGSRVAGSKLSQIALLLEQHKQECDESGDEFSALVLVSRRDLAAQLPKMLEAVPSLKSFVKAEHVVGGNSRMTPQAGRRSAPASSSSAGGPPTVLVSTSAGADGIDLPASALVVCTSLPGGGTELARLRGRIGNHGEQTRFVGLTRTSRVEEQVHAERLLTREKNMLEAVKILTGGVGINYAPMTSVTPVDGAFPPPCFAAKKFASISLEEDDDANRWKHGDLPSTLAPVAARASAMVHLAMCVKQARQKNPNQNARSAMNSASQLAHMIKPTVRYDERKEPSWYDGQMFRARCLVSSQPGEEQLEGLLLVKEGRGLSLKAAREAAAAKAMQYLLWVSKAHTAQPLDFAA